MSNTYLCGACNAEADAGDSGRACPVAAFFADSLAVISGEYGGGYPSPVEHDEMMLRRLHGSLRALDEHPAAVPLDELVDAAVQRRLRAIVERLRVSADGPLVPEAEVYVRTVVAKAIDEELEER